MKKLTRKQQEKEKLILENASILFAEKGYFNTNMLDIATKSNIGKGTIYNYFENKEDIFLKGIQYQLNKSLSTIMNKLKHITEIRPYIEAYIDNALEYYAKNSYSFEILFQSSRTLFHKAMKLITETQNIYISKFKHRFLKDFEKINSSVNPELIFLTIQAGIFAMMHEYRNRKDLNISELKETLKYLYIEGLNSKATIQ